MATTSTVTVPVLLPATGSAVVEDTVAVLTWPAPTRPALATIVKL
jgi:hypothetical protein